MAFMKSIKTGLTDRSKIKYIQYVIQKSNLFWLLFCTLSVQTSGSFAQESEELTVYEEGSYCGYIQFPTDPTIILNVTERQVIDQNVFEKVYTKFSNSSIVVQNPLCEIVVCGFSKGLTSVFSNNPYGFGQCDGFSKPTTLVNGLQQSDQFEITAVTCGCKKPDYNDCLNFDYCDMLPVSPYLCANLYEEDRCKSCVYQDIELKPGEVFKTQNSVVIKSANVRDNCTLSRTIYGDRYKEGRKMEFFNLGNKEIETNYFKRSDDYSCTCDDTNVTNVTKNLSPPEVNHFWSKNMTAVSVSVLIFIILSISFGVLIYRRRIELHKKKENDMDDDGLITLEGLTTMPFEPKIDSKFLIDKKHVKLGKFIGRGEFGLVYEGTVKIRKQKPRKVALKTIDYSTTEKYKGELLSRLIQEIELTAGIGKHLNVVEFIGVSDLTKKSLRKPNHVIIMEICLPKNLKEHLEFLRMGLRKPSTATEADIQPSSFQPPLFTDGQYWSPPEPQLIKENIYVEIDNELLKRLLKWSKEIADGMEYLHSLKVLHKDLAARNVLLSLCGDFVAKICDFGLSRKLYDKSFYACTNKSKIPFSWTAPEYLSNKVPKIYTLKCDIWSYGVTLWEIFNLGREPLYPVEAKEDADRFELLLRYLRDGKRLESPKFGSQAIYDQMLSCWDMDPKSRPSFNDMNIFFTNLLDNIHN